MACGSIGYGSIDQIRGLYSLLRICGFKTVDHLVEKGMDYSDIPDFRDKKELSRQIVNHDLEYVKKADVLVVKPFLNLLPFFDKFINFLRNSLLEDEFEVLRP